MSLERGDALALSLEIKDRSPSMTLSMLPSVNDLVPYEIAKALLQVAFVDCTMIRACPFTSNDRASY